MAKAKDPSPIAEAALEYARRGVAVFPLHGIFDDGSCTCRRGPQCFSAGKHPREIGWYESASTDLKVVERMFTFPYSNIGVACGRRYNLVVLDIDPKKGGEFSLDLLIEECGEFVQDTVTSITGSKGRHIYFSLDRDLPTKKDILPGLDIRANGGLVVAPPSLHASGNTYAWDGDELGIGRLEPAPKWIDNILENHRREEWQAAHGTSLPARQIDGTVHGKAYYEAAMKRIYGEIVGAPQGERHTVLIARAARVGNFVALGVIEEQDAIALLLRATNENRLVEQYGERAVLAVIQRQLNFGIAQTGK